jgi:hypothetical protein
MILEKGIPQELLKEAYWFRASNRHIYAVTLEFNYSDDKSYLKSVKAKANEIDTNDIDSDVDFNSIKNGDKVMAFSIFGDWVLEIDIWGKYYFPKLNEDKNQWYHKMVDYEYDADYIDDFYFILKETYKIAMKVSGLKTY